MALKNKIITLRKTVLLHVSPSKNRQRILKEGLKVGEQVSDYGGEPTQKALYLYHKEQITTIYDLLEVFPEFDVYEVTGLDHNFARPDEISNRRYWKESIQRFGTVAYIKDIPVRHIKHLCTITKPISSRG